MRVMIDIPDTLDPKRYAEVLKKINEIHNIVYGTSREIGFHAPTTAKDEEPNDIDSEEDIERVKKIEEETYLEYLEGLKRYSEAHEPVKPSVKEKVGLPALTRTDIERDKEITRIIKSLNAPSDAKTRIAKTVYKNMTKIYGVVWEQSTKEYKQRWNIDTDIKVPKRRVVIDSGGLYRLYKSLLLDAVEHYNKNKGGSK